MHDDAALALAWTVLPGAAHEPTRHVPDPLSALMSARRDPDGGITTWPTCSRTGNTSALAQVVDPIDPLDPADDTTHLLTHQRHVQHNAHVLALAVHEARLGKS